MSTYFHLNSYEIIILHTPFHNTHDTLADDVNAVRLYYRKHCNKLTIHFLCNRVHMLFDPLLFLFHYTQDRSFWMNQNLILNFHKNWRFRMFHHHNIHYYYFGLDF